MLTSLHAHPQKMFTFGLVELQVFKDSNVPGRHLIVPQVIAKTTEIVRAVVRVETTGPASVSVEIDDHEPERQTGSSRRTLSYDEFFGAIHNSDTVTLFSELLSFAEEIGAEARWRSSSVSIRLPDPAGSDQRLTLFVMTKNGEIYPGWLATQLNKIGKPSQIAYDYVMQLCSLFPGIKPKEKSPDTLENRIIVSELSEKREEFIEIVRSIVDRITNEG